MEGGTLCRRSECADVGLPLVVPDVEVDQSARRRGEQLEAEWLRIVRG